MAHVLRGAALLPGFSDVVAECAEATACATPIFNGGGPHDDGDGARLQARLVPGRAMRAWLRALRPLLPHHGALLPPREFHVLRSLPGCARQQAHTDFDPAGFPARAPPFAVLVALEDGTRLHTWDGGHVLHELGAGDVLVFRGDVPHAGAAYARENTRLHFYLDSTAARREGNKVWDWPA